MSRGAGAPRSGDATIVSRSRPPERTSPFVVMLLWVGTKLRKGTPVVTGKSPQGRRRRAYWSCNPITDIGIGDAVWPAPREQAYPAMLEFPAPRVLTYSREAVVAEKFEAMVVLGARNSRIKDFFDIHYLATHFAFNGADLAEAIRRTFARRKTPLPEEIPVGLTEEYWKQAGRDAQLRAFVRRARMEVDSQKMSGIAPTLRKFLLPPCEALMNKEPFAQHWPVGGSWQPV